MTRQELLQRAALAYIASGHDGGDIIQEAWDVAQVLVRAGEKRGHVEASLLPGEQRVASGVIDREAYVAETGQRVRELLMGAAASTLAEKVERETVAAIAKALEEKAALLRAVDDGWPHREAVAAHLCIEASGVLRGAWKVKP